MQTEKGGRVYGASRSYPGDISTQRCCCGMLSMRGGVYAIGVVHVVSSVIAIGSLIAAYITLWERNYGLQLLASLGSLAIGIVVCLLIMALVVVMFMGLRSGAPVLILPHLIAQIFMLIGLLFCFIVSLITLIGACGAFVGPNLYSTSNVYTNAHLNSLTKALSASTLILSFFGFFVELYFLSVVGTVYRAYMAELQYRG